MGTAGTDETPERGLTARGVLGALGGAVRVTGVVVGLLLTLFCLMATAGILTDSLWARLVPAVAVTIALAFGLVVWLLRRDPFLSTGQLADAVALGWLGFGVAFAVFGHTYTGAWLAHESRRLGEHLPWEVAAAAAVVARAPLPSRPAAGRPVPEEPLRPPVDELGVDAGVDSSIDADGALPEAADVGAAEAVVVVDAADAPAAEPPPELSVTELIERAGRAMVVVSVRYEDGGEASVTGTVVGRGDRVATCAAVVEDAASLAVRRADGSWAEETALVAAEVGLGVAILAVPHAGDPLPSAEPASFDSGEPLYALRSPLGLEPVLSVVEVVPDDGETEDEERALRSTGGSPLSGCSLLLTRRGQLAGLAAPADDLDEAESEGGAIGITARAVGRLLPGGALATAPRGGVDLAPRRW